MRKRLEENLQISVSTYIKLAYPTVIFTSESSGVRVSMGTAVKMTKQRSVGALPDMIILEPRSVYHGLCLELKKDRSEVYLKSGLISNNKHIQEQNDMLIRLGEKGYCARFACGFDEAKSILDNYLSH